MTRSDEGEVRHGLANLYFAETTITEIDGQRGTLTHRGHPIQDLVNQPYESLVYLLLEGSWPTNKQYSEFCKTLLPFRDLPEGLIDLINRQKGMSADIVLQTCLSYLSDAEDLPDFALVSLAPSIVAVHSALRHGRDSLPPDPSLGIAADCLRRLLGRPITDLEANIINADFVLHADHDANASAFVARIATSALASPIRCVAAAIATFSGLRHGGVVASVADMLDSVALEDIPSFIRTQNQALASFVGTGQRVYETEDPRAKLLLKFAEQLSQAAEDRLLLKKAQTLIDSMEQGQSTDFSTKIDLYSTVIYRLLGVEIDQLTAMTAISRVAGWLAQIREQQTSSNMLIRPLLRYKANDSST